MFVSLIAGACCGSYRVGVHGWLVFAVRARVYYVLCRGIMYSVWVRVVRMALVMLSMRVNDVGCVRVWVSD